MRWVKDWIEATKDNPLGLIALIVTLIAFISLQFLRREEWKIKIAWLCALLIAAALLIWNVTINAKVKSGNQIDKTYPPTTETNADIVDVTLTSLSNYFPASSVLDDKIGGGVATLYDAQKIDGELHWLGRIEFQKDGNGTAISPQAINVPLEVDRVVSRMTRGATTSICTSGGAPRRLIDSGHPIYLDIDVEWGAKHIKYQKVVQDCSD